MPCSDQDAVSNSSRCRCCRAVPTAAFISSGSVGFDGGLGTALSLQHHDVGLAVLDNGHEPLGP
jgi:hypothetical protein